MGHHREEKRLRFSLPLSVHVTPHRGKEEPSLVSPATTMSQRFTVSKSDGDRRPSDIQGEVNQLFEGDEPTTSAGAEGDDAVGTEVEVVLKGRETLTPVSFCLLAMGCMLAVPVLDCCLVTPHCLWTGV